MNPADLDEEAFATLDLLAFLNLCYGRTRAADQLYAFLLRVRPGDARLLRASALARHLSGHSEEALALGQEGLKRCASSRMDAMAAHLLQSEILAALGRPEEASEHARQYITRRTELS